GFSGSGYVNLNNETGSLVEWTVSVPKAVSGTLTFRFANGSSSDRPMEIRVNGLAVDSSLSFPATGRWSTWKGQTLPAALNAGSNVVRAVSLTAEDRPNLDRLEVNDGLPAAVDWGRALVDSTMKRFPTASDLGGWEYSRGFFLYGAYQVYQRTRDPRYLRYIEDWVDAHVSDSGAID